MEKFMQFVHDHWLLWSALVAVFLAIILEESRMRMRKALGLTPQQLTTMLNHHEAMVVDVREAQVFQKGHILSAINMPTKNKLDAAMLQKLRAEKNKQIVIVDNDGNTAFGIANALRKENFEKVSALAGGIRAWKNANLPLV